MPNVVDNTARRRFELSEDGYVAFADYQRQGGRLIISYVESPMPLRGKGTAGRLLEGVLAAAREQGLKVTPICGYAAAYIRRHKQHHDLLD